MNELDPTIQELWNQETVSNAGIKAGIIRVKVGGVTKFYLVGANFRGNADSWYVSPKMAEIEFAPPEIEGKTV